MTIKDVLKEYKRGNIVIHDPDKQEIVIKKETFKMYEIEFSEL